MMNILVFKVAGVELKSFLAITQTEDRWLLFNRFTFLVYGEGTFAEVTNQANSMFELMVRGLLGGEVFTTSDSFNETYASKIEGLANSVRSSTHSYNINEL